jgi:hydrogenase-4 component B
VLNHAIFKGLLFLTSGSVLYATHTKDLNKLGGLIKLMPVTAAVAGIASLSISGVPPFSGSRANGRYLLLAPGRQRDALLVVFGASSPSFTSAVTLSCYVKFFGMTFTSAGAEWSLEQQGQGGPRVMLAPKLVLTALASCRGSSRSSIYTIIGIFKNSGGSMLSAAFTGLEIEKYVFSSGMGVTVELPGLGAAVSSVAAPAMVLLVFAIAFVLVWALKRSGGPRARGPHLAVRLSGAA